MSCGGYESHPAHRQTSLLQQVNRSVVAPDPSRLLGQGVAACFQQLLGGPPRVTGHGSNTLSGVTQGFDQQVCMRCLLGVATQVGASSSAGSPAPSQHHAPHMRALPSQEASIPCTPTDVDSTYIGNTTQPTHLHCSRVCQAANSPPRRCTAAASAASAACHLVTGAPRWTTYTEQCRPAATLYTTHTTYISTVQPWANHSTQGDQQHSTRKREGRLFKQGPPLLVSSQSASQQWRRHCWPAAAPSPPPALQPTPSCPGCNPWWWVL